MEEKKRRQFEKLRAEEKNTSVTNDVVKTEYEAYPGHLEEVNEDADFLNEVEEAIIQNKTDGKTYIDRDE